MNDLEEKTVEKLEVDKLETVAKPTTSHWFGRGIYGSKDVPIRLLDAFIIIVFLTIASMVFWFATHGGYDISFDTDGGSQVAEQKLRYGEFVKEPDIPLKPGYQFLEWVTSQDETIARTWDFKNDIVEEGMILYAVWTPAEIAVKFDLDGGQVDDDQILDKKVIFGEKYGKLPVPQKDGYIFDGWVYSGEVITEESTVTMTGEHVLTARWI